MRSPFPNHFYIVPFGWYNALVRDMNCVSFHKTDNKPAQDGNVNRHGKQSSIPSQNTKEHKMSNNGKTAETLIYSTAWGF